MFEELKSDTLKWLDAHGVNTSKDFLKLNILWAVIVMASVYFPRIPTISALDFYKVTAFMTVIAYILYAAAKPKPE